MNSIIVALLFIFIAVPGIWMAFIFLLVGLQDIENKRHKTSPDAYLDTLDYIVKFSDFIASRPKGELSDSDYAECFVHLRELAKSKAAFIKEDIEIHENSR